MWVVFEGCDGTGKSTLADEVRRQLVEVKQDVMVTHVGPPASPETVLSENIDGPYAMYRVGGSFDMVTDRWSWGNPVYGPIYRPNTSQGEHGDIGKGGLRYTELFGLSRGQLTVYIEADVATIRERLDTRGDDYIDFNDLEAIADAYEKVVDRTALPVFRITRHTLDGVPFIAQSIIKQARAHERLADVVRPWPEYVGALAPRVLLVGNGLEPILEWLEDAGEDEWQSIGYIDLTKSTSSRVEDFCRAFNVESRSVVSTGTMLTLVKNSAE